MIISSKKPRFAYGKASATSGATLGNIVEKDGPTQTKSVPYSIQTYLALPISSSKTIPHNARPETWAYQIPQNSAIFVKNTNSEKNYTQSENTRNMSQRIHTITPAHLNFIMRERFNDLMTLIDKFPTVPIDWNAVINYCMDDFRFIGFSISGNEIASDKIPVENSPRRMNCSLMSSGPIINYHGSNVNIGDHLYFVAKFVRDRSSFRIGSSQTIVSTSQRQSFVPLLPQIGKLGASVASRNDSVSISEYLGNSTSVLQPDVVEESNKLRKIYHENIEYFNNKEDSKCVEFLKIAKPREILPIAYAYYNTEPVDAFFDFIASSEDYFEDIPYDVAKMLDYGFKHGDFNVVFKHPFGVETGYESKSGILKENGSEIDSVNNVFYVISKVLVERLKKEFGVDNELEYIDGVFKCYDFKPEIFTPKSSSSLTTRLRFLKNNQHFATQPLNVTSYVSNSNIVVAPTSADWDVVKRFALNGWQPARRAWDENEHGGRMIPQLVGVCSQSPLTGEDLMQFEHDDPCFPNFFYAIPIKYGICTHVPSASTNNSYNLYNREKVKETPITGVHSISGEEMLLEAYYSSY